MKILLFISLFFIGCAKEGTSIIAIESNNNSKWMIEGGFGGNPNLTFQDCCSSASDWYSHDSANAIFYYDKLNNLKPMSFKYNYFGNDTGCIIDAH